MAAVSCGIYQGTPVLDLDYAEDSAAETDANFVITGSGGLVEVQGTAEGKPFSEEEFLSLLRLAKGGVDPSRRAAEEGRGVIPPAKGGMAQFMHRLLTGKVVIATHNPGKLREMRELLAPYRRRGGLGGRARPARAG